jgi:hypothetical protein
LQARIEQARVNRAARLSEYRRWAPQQHFDGCRLVQYASIDLVGTLDVPVAGIESQIEGLLAEGFHVDWAIHQGRLYLRVWEQPGPCPDWGHVFAERSVPAYSSGGAEMREDDLRA